MPGTITLSDIIPASPQQVFAAWLDADEHGKMTGAAMVDQGDGRFTASDGYISGRTVRSVPHSKIVQAWRTTEFPKNHPDSTLTIDLAPEGTGTRVTISQEHVPEGQAEAYREGWRTWYFEPMKAYFSGPLPKVRAAISQANDELEAIAEQAVSTLSKAGARLRSRVQALVTPKPKPKTVAAKKPARAGKRTATTKRPASTKRPATTKRPAPAKRAPTTQGKRTSPAPRKGKR